MKTMLCFIALVTICFSTALALGADKVVVIPLLGGMKPTGDATAADVLKGKTFSNASEIGVTGIRPPVPVEKTGQTKSFNTPDGGDDGDYEKGEAWPIPRFGSDPFRIGRIDYATRLLWWWTLLDQYQWAGAIKACEDLETGGPFHLTTDWRLPNVKELLSLIDYGQADPTLPSDHPFTGIQTDDFYWTSTTDPSDFIFGAYVISFRNGMVGTGLKIRFEETPAHENYVLCVRGPF